VTVNVLTPPRTSQLWQQLSQSLTRSEATTVVRAAEAVDPVFWAEHHFYIEDRAHPVTGQEMGPGPILLAPHQRRIVRAALERDDAGAFRWSTIVYSAPKKSGKTRIAAMVAAWLAWRSGQYSEVYCLANDGKQSADRVLAAIKKAIDLGGLDWRDIKTRIELPSGSFIEAIPVDPTGEAGANPTGTFWSEMWGFRLSAKERLWTEMTIPPTRHGRAIRWVESYAGYTGESPVLEQLYHQGVEEGHHIAHELKDHLRAEIPSLGHVLIHVEPHERKDNFK
jgi:phage terminase large subunit-like protein